MFFTRMGFGVNVEMTLPATTSRTILLAGPTATGKTALAVQLARALDGEIISADSMQIYRGFIAGTAQPSEEELQGISCHLVNCIEPWAAWTAADWRREALAKITEIHARDRRAIIAGGTGLYFKALTEGLFESQGAARNPGIRARLEAEWEQDDGKKLWQRLLEVDSETAARIHENDKLRVVRALEVFESAGAPLSLLQAQGRLDHRPFPGLRLVLSASRQELYDRIDRRVIEMMKSGFVEEVQGLLAAGACDDWPAMRALGYPQVVDYLQGRISRDNAIAQTQRLSRRYAKQQIVLLRNWPASVWMDISIGMQKIVQAAQILLEF